MNSRMCRALVAVSAALSLSAGTLVASDADDVGTAAGAQGSRNYKFLYHVNGHIGRWNPCKTIHYEINARKAQRKGAVKDVRKAIKRVHAASGLTFKYLGRTKVVPKGFNNNYRGKTDLVIAWTTPRKRKVLRNLGGYGGGWAVLRRGAKYARVKNGFVLLNSKYWYNYPRGFGADGKYGSRGQLLMHELGHTVGLDHVSSKKQIMFRHTRHRKAEWGAGDRKGLRKVGRPAGCGGFRLPERGTQTDLPVGTAFGSD